MSIRSTSINTVSSMFSTRGRSPSPASNFQDKRNLWWKAFRKTVLEPHAIVVLETPMTDKVPYELLSIVENKFQNLERHERQALAFVDAIGRDKGFDTSLAFPSEILPAIQASHVTRCLEAVFDQATVPSQEDTFSIPLFDMPLPRPSLATGFGRNIFSEAEFAELPCFLAANGIEYGRNAGSIQQKRNIYCNFLLFERSYGCSRHEIESAMNYCAMDGAAALNGISMLYDMAWPEPASRPAQKPVVFSCTIDNDLGIINHHWQSNGGYFVAPLCKFDFRDLEHLMHFLAWVEAIEEWAGAHLLVDIRKALRVLLERKAVSSGLKALPSPVTDIEKQEKLSHAMRLAFDNIPWKGERARNTPLGVTSAMRMRSPRPTPETKDSLTPKTSSDPHSCTAVDLPLRERRSSEKPHQKARMSSDPNLVEAEKPKPVQEPPIQALEAEKKHPIPIDISHDLAVANKKKDSRIGLFLVKSAGLPKTSEPLNVSRPITSARLATSDSITSSTATMPILRPSSSDKNNGLPTSTTEMQSPAASMMSVQSKRSFTSLRRGRKLKSPNTPDFAVSPKENINGLKFKITNSLDMIKEHAIPRRNRSDNSAPNSARQEIALPTPAYDKKRFDIKTPRPTTFPEKPANANFSLPLSTTNRAEPPMPLNKTSMQEAYDAKHGLPLRQWAASPRSAKTHITTLTANG